MKKIFSRVMMGCMALAFTLGLAACEKPCEHTSVVGGETCTTAVTCADCGETVTAAKGSHTPKADDGDCTTAVTCADCGSEVIESKEHSFGMEWKSDASGHYRVCQNDGCEETEASGSWEVTEVLRPFVDEETDHVFADEFASNLFDNDPYTKWCLDGEYADEIFVEFHFDCAVLLRSYRLTIANDTQDYFNRNWKDWTIYGKDLETGEWEVVNKITDAKLPINCFFVTGKFEVNATEAYQSYKLVVDAAVGGAVADEAVQMAGMDLTVTSMRDNNHFGGEATCQNGKLCELCGYEYDTKLNIENHVWSSFADMGNGMHEILCECGVFVGCKPHDRIDSATGYCICGAYVAKARVEWNGEVTYYSTLNRAVTAASEMENSTVVLIESVNDGIEPTLIEVGNFTIDFNGMYYCPDYGDIYVYGGCVTLMDSVGNATFRAGVVVNGGNVTIDSGVYGSITAHTNTLTIKSATVDLISMEETVGHPIDLIAEGTHYYDNSGNPMRIDQIIPIVGVSEYGLLSVTVAEAGAEHSAEDCAYCGEVRYTLRLWEGMESYAKIASVNGVPVADGETVKVVRGEEVTVVFENLASDILDDFIFSIIKINNRYYDENDGCSFDGTTLTIDGERVIGNLEISLYALVSITIDMAGGTCDDTSLFEVNDGIATAISFNSVGASVNLLNHFERDGYVLVGYTDADGNVYGVAYDVTCDLNITLLWEKAE